MMKFRIMGADAKTGVERTVDVDADSEIDALHKAKRQGIFADRIVHQKAIKDVDQPASSPPKNGCTHCGHPVSRTARTCPQCGGKWPFPLSRIEKVIGGIIASILCGSLLLCFGLIGWSAITGGSSSRSNGARTGESASLRAEGPGMIPVAASKNAFDRMVDLSIAKDEIGLAQMRLTGLIWMEPQGTRVHVISPGLFAYEVRLLSGDHQGQSCIVASDFVRR